MDSEIVHVTAARDIYQILVAAVDNSYFGDSGGEVLGVGKQWHDIVGLSKIS